MVGLLSLAGAVGSVQAAQAEPTCVADVVIFVDTSGSMICSPTIGVPPTDCNVMAWIANQIKAAITELEQNAAYDLRYTVYYHEEGSLVSPAPRCSLDQLNSIETDFPGLVDVLPLKATLDIPNQSPSCLTSSAGIGGLKNFPPVEMCGPEGQTEDWAHTLAYVAQYHAWRQPTACEASNTYKRFYFSISDEGPRCGNECDARPRDPNIAGDIGGADWRGVREGSACAIAERVLAFPVIGCCGSGAIESDGGATLGGTTSCSPNCIGQNNICNCICTSEDCTLPAAKLMARYTTGGEFNARLVTWFDPQNRLQTHITNSVNSVMCSPLDCDPIDFNNDGLFPADEDLVDFLAVLAGGTCANAPVCFDLDFNNDCLFPSDDDLIAFLRVLAGGSCG